MCARNPSDHAALDRRMHNPRLCLAWYGEEYEEFSPEVGNRYKDDFGPGMARHMPRVEVARLSTISVFAVTWREVICRRPPHNSDLRPHWIPTRDITLNPVSRTLRARRGVPIPLRGLIPGLERV